MSDISPYSPARSSKPLRSFKSDPYKHLFSRWSITKWANYFLAAGLFVWAVTDPDQVNMIEKFVILFIQLGYYFLFLHNAQTMEKTFTRWNFRFQALQKKHVVVKFKNDNEYLHSLIPLKEIIVSVPGSVMLLKYVGNKYAVMWRAYPKKNEDDNIQELELRVKKFLDGIPENLVFKSIWYTVDNPKQESRKALEHAANEGEPNKSRDIHNQALINYVDNDDRSQSVGKDIYFMELGVCNNVNKAIQQFNAFVPGMEEILRPALNGLVRVTNPSEVYGIFEEIWGTKEVTE